MNIRQLFVIANALQEAVCHSRLKMCSFSLGSVDTQLW